MDVQQFLDTMRSVDTIVVNGGHHIKKTWILLLPNGDPTNKVFGVVVYGYDAPNGILTLTEGDVKRIKVKHNVLTLDKKLRIEVFQTEVVTLNRPFMIMDRLPQL